MKNFSDKKSGQAALILVIVTMVTVLGIGIASSTQSTINLRDTVYSTQSEQALGCAEAGAEYAIGVIDNYDSVGAGTYYPNTPGETEGSGTGYLTSETCANDCVDPSSAPSTYDCSFTYKIYTYPSTDSPDGASVVKAPKINENAVQEFNFKPVNETKTIKAHVDILDGDRTKSSLAVYYYSNDGAVSVTRKFYYLGTSEPNPDAFADFNDQSNSDGSATREFDLTVPPQTVAIRIRPLYSDMSVKFTNYPEGVSVAYFLTSVGRSGPVKREINAYRYLSQLPAAFDEAVVLLGE